MKKIYTIIVIALLSINSFAQAPNFTWAKKATGSDLEEGVSVATDASGNVYVTGDYNCHLTFPALPMLFNALQDMFVAKYDASGTALWANSIGGNDFDQPMSIATDASANVYVTGYWRSPFLSFAGTTFNNTATGSEMILAKYDSNGNELWAKVVGGTSDDVGNSVATDASGNIYVTGYFGSTSLVFGTTTLTNISGNVSVFIVKYDSSGNVLWAKSSATGSGRGMSVAMDASGNAIITGFYNSPIVFGTITLPNTTGTDDIFIAKYDASGNVIWAKNAGGTASDDANSVKTDASGNIYITGAFGSPSIVFGSTTLTTAGSNDMFIAKYDVNGNALWAKSAGGTGYDVAASIAVDATGAYITGSFGSTSILFGTTTLTNSGGTEINLVKYDLNGNVLWAKSAGGNSYEWGNCVALYSGNIYLTGGFYSSPISFGSLSLANTGSTSTTYDMYVAKLATTVSIEEETSLEGINIYPNPFASQTTIDFAEDQRNITIKIMDVVGNEIKTINFTGKQLVIDKAEMKAGIYFVQTTDEQKNISNRKIVIQ